jgi:hypothetical protein
MAWRLQLSNRPIRRIDLLTGKPSLLAAWTQPDRATYFDLQHGTRLEDRVFDEPATAQLDDPKWQAYTHALRAPNEAILPYVRANQVAVFRSLDGTVQLYQHRSGTLTLSEGGQHTALALDNSARIVCTAFDRAQGTTALLDVSGRLHLYRRRERIGAFPLELTIDPERHASLAIADGGHVLYASDGEQVALADAHGHVRRRFQAHFSIGTIACSPDGKLLAVTDLESSVIRIYNGGDLRATHQSFAVDLLANARRAQLLPINAVTGAALGPVVINNRGVLAFALSGILCVSNVSRMSPLPGGPASERPTHPDRPPSAPTASPDASGRGERATPAGSTGGATAGGSASTV